MKRYFFRLASLISLTSMLSFAGSWSGVLVDADCYNSSPTNTKHGTHPATMSPSRHIKACPPTADTKSFAVVQQDGSTVNLDPDGNQKAHDLVAKEGKMSRYKVNVSGDMNQNMVKVDTISAAK